MCVWGGGRGVGRIKACVSMYVCEELGVGRGVVGVGG